MNILIKKMAESVKQPLSFNRLRNVIVSTGSALSVPTTIDYPKSVIRMSIIYDF